MRLTPKIAVTFVEFAQKPNALALAKQLNLPLVDKQGSYYPLMLVYTPERLELRAFGAEKFNPIAVDFLHGKLAHRQHYGGGRGQLIARAVGLRANPRLTVLDLTAGLGSDGFILASLGAQVTLVERSPIIAALLADGLARAKASDSFTDLALRLIETDGHAYLEALSERPDVIYLDPMFPAAKKTALVKKEMRVLRQIVGDDLDAAALLPLALKKAKKRVVVKRSQHAPPLTADQPDFACVGKSSRFDVYSTLVFRQKSKKL